LEIGADQGRLQFGNLSDRLCAELPRTRIRHSRRNWQRRPTANPRVDVNQAHELHLSSGISLCRRRFGHAEPLLLAQRCDDLRLWRSGGRRLDLSARRRCDPQAVRRATPKRIAALQSHGRHAAALPALSWLPSNPQQDGPVRLLPKRSLEKSVRVTKGAASRRCPEEIVLVPLSSRASHAAPK
jgi:hypothetical protein